MASRLSISCDETRAVYAQGEEVVIALVEGFLGGYLSTLQKQGHDLFDALVQLFRGTPISPIPKS